MNAVPNNRLSDDVCVCAVLLLEEAVDVVAVMVVVVLLMMIMMMTAAIAGHKRSMALLQALQSWRCING